MAVADTILVVVDRKLHIRTRVPLSDFRSGMGKQHTMDAEQLEREHSSLQALPQKDLADFVAHRVELAIRRVLQSTG